ncbi:hypothetical protein FRACA_1240015 [Frankia canadensis]|uniref:Uncharacterized protein n=1 Tax=Frankia canadensis TaxID=1836972 RepID=A0A2I2KK87_9ACTN|nr:hypothetical protein FRACA_1240015 [Frankia canadensis]SOU53370.1 hypothetical protein FRACA_1240015 [Frankia canadensis]
MKAHLREPASTPCRRPATFAFRPRTTRSRPESQPSENCYPAPPVGTVTVDAGDGLGVVSGLVRIRPLCYRLSRGATGGDDPGGLPWRARR